MGAKSSPFYRRSTQTMIEDVFVYASHNYDTLHLFKAVNRL